MKKIVNTVLVLVLVVPMALIGFVYYAWMVQKRSKSASEWMIHTNLQIDRLRTLALLDNNYTNNIREMLLLDKTTLSTSDATLPDSMKKLLHVIQTNENGDTATRQIMIQLNTILQQKIDYNRQVLLAAAQQPALAKQLITASQSKALRSRLRWIVMGFIQVKRNSLITRISKDNQYTLYSFWTTITISLFTLLLILIESRYIYRLFKKLKTRTNQLYKREQCFMRLAEETELILFKAGLDGIFTYVSKRAAEMTGYTNTELVGKHFSIFLKEATWKKLEEFYLHQVTTGDDYTFQEFEIITKSGARRWVEQLATIIYSEDGTINGFQCIVRDIDKKKNNDDQQDYLQECLDAILDNMPSMMFIKNLDGKYLVVNNRFSEMIGIPKKDIIGKRDEALHCDWVTRYAELDQEVISTGARVKQEDIITVNDQTFHFLIIKFPLYNQEEELIGICSIGQDFTEKAVYIQAMEKAHQHATEAINAQDMFLANMSHEIRTPMNGIIGMTNLLMQQKELTPIQLEYTNAIKRSANHLLSIINEILDFSKIKAGKLHLQRQPFDLFEVIDNTLFPLKLQAQQKGLAFFDETDNAIPTRLLGDEIRLKQILTNLVENAIKFTPSGKILFKVSLAGESTDSATIRLGFEITDTGIGIAPEQHELIFQSFSQTHADNARKFGGTGLGLTITKELITLQDGFITVDSQLNEGASFYFELPFIRNHAVITNKAEKELLLSSDKPLQGKTILVVEDNEINQQVVFHTLRGAGARTDVVNNGHTALEMLDHKLYDCIIMDIQMPDMDGYQTTQAIRQKGIQTCIIAMTASAIKGEKERCLLAGMNNYISKPFEPQDLFHMILKELGEPLPETTEKAPPAKIVTGTPLNLDTVYNMMSGESDHVKILLEELLDSIPQKFTEMNYLVKEQRWEPLYMLAHQMKFNLNVAGMKYASEMAYTIERDARLTENLDSIPTRIREIMDIYYQHVPLIKEHIEQC
ncbi:PAS domain S-box protein [Chitinophaga sp. 30R24]|uniref:PAS domain S-box protein n=1 Tax=Chitinophaga sp. 30R24 TaxID=3248838 RepID=UPI003B8F249D